MLRIRFTTIAPLFSVLLVACTQHDQFVQSNALSRVGEVVNALSQNPFAALDAATTVAAGISDSVTPNLVSGPSPVDVRRCDVNAYETERQQALAAARADVTRKTIPVRFAISVGSLFDSIAYYAHLRAVLRTDRGNTTPVPVGAANNLNEDTYDGVKSFHYFADHTQARQDYIHGVKCFFDTIQVVGTESGHGIYRDGVNYDHPWNIMFYGDVYDAGDPDVTAGKISPRLFVRLDQQDYVNSDPQIIPLYMADIRNQALRVDGSSPVVTILNPNFASSAIRRHEYLLSYREEFDLKALFTHRDDLAQVLSTARRLMDGSGNILPNGAVAPAGQIVYQMSAYEGVPQLIDNVVSNSQLEADMMSMQYTPIVLDLGAPDIRLSSVDWGTFFNMAGLQVHTTPDNAGITNISHQTAWLGGTTVNSPSANSLQSFLPHSVADDGFLVVPDANGEINNSRNLFGSLTPVTINGVTQTYENGFQALAAMAGKDCTSSDLKKQFVGPWDGDLYAKTLKVWVDANRNGKADSGEVQSLEQARVAAIDACAIVKAHAVDDFGNKTELRAAFLYLDAGEKAVGNEAEILSRLTTGKRADGVSAAFRLAVDVFFMARPSNYLENVAEADIRSPEMSAAVVQMASSALGLPPISSGLLSAPVLNSAHR